MATPTRPYALVTGASKGIGRAFAEACAAEGRNLALVSLPGEELAKVAEEIAHAHKVKAIAFEADLSKQEAAQQVFDWCAAQGIQVDLLINNAGFGTVGSFADASLPTHLTMFGVNMVTPYILMKLFLPGMLALPSAGILNVSSQAGLLPVPFKGTYSATKSFIYILSRAMAYELKGTSVHVGVVTPSGVPTNAAVRRRIESAGLMGRLSMVEADEVARYALKAMRRRKQLIIPGRVNRLAYFLTNIMPLSMNMHFAANQVRKDLER